MRVTRIASRARAPGGAAHQQRPRPRRSASSATAGRRRVSRG